MKTYDFSKGKRGAVLPVALGKVRITIRFDCEILNYFRDQVERAGGGQLPDPYEHCVARLHRRQEVGS